MDYRREVQEYYWMNNSGRDGRPLEVVYRSQRMDGEHLFQSAMVMCVMYFVARLFFNGLVDLLVVGLTVALVLQLLESVSSAIRPHTQYSYSRRRVY